MTRKITLNGVKLEVSKNEHNEVGRIQIMRMAGPEAAQRAFDTWLLNTTPQARERRIAVGKALRLRVPE